MRSVPAPYDTNPDLGELVVAEDELHARIDELGKQLTADYEGRPPLLVTERPRHKKEA